MVNGGPYKLMPEQTFLHGRNYHCLQLSPSTGSFLVHYRGSGICRRSSNQSIICRLRSFDNRVNMKSGKTAKRNLIDANGAGIAKSPTEPGDVSSQSAASPASDMDMTEDEEAEIDADDDDEFTSCRGLVLDLAYRPINVINWKRALCLDILEKAEVLEYYDQVIYSPNRMFFIPAVLKVNSLVHSPRHRQPRITLNRKNIFMRDKYRCQYCNSDDNLTIDHVYAASKGGGWTWENLVTACSACNVKKASKTVEEAHMALIKAPKEPKLMENICLPPNYKTYRSLRVTHGTPPEWINYLPKGIGATMFQ
ncbi:unnamed protein product [Calypogeia fissa]